MAGGGREGVGHHGRRIGGGHAALALANAMVAMHDAAVTHFFFMSPGLVLPQIVPVGLNWTTNAFYSKPAQQLGLEYLEYKVAPKESSLRRHQEVRQAAPGDAAAPQEHHSMCTEVEDANQASLGVDYLVTG